MITEEPSVETSPHSLTHSQGQPEVLTSYDELHIVEGRVYHPKSWASLGRFLERLSMDTAAHRITFRAGGQAVDGQALGRDVVIVLDAPEMRAIGEPVHDARGWHVTVGAAAAWGDILAKVLADQGHLPWSVVTTSHATAGGTVSADCLSRSSPISGREGKHVLAFKLLMLDGRMIDLRPRRPDARDPRVVPRGRRGARVPGGAHRAHDRAAPAVARVEAGAAHLRGDAGRQAVASTSSWKGFLPMLREREGTEEPERQGLIAQIADAVLPHEAAREGEVGRGVVGGVVRARGDRGAGLPVVVRARSRARPDAALPAGVERVQAALPGDVQLHAGRAGRERDVRALRRGRVRRRPRRLHVLHGEPVHADEEGGERAAAGGSTPSSRPSCSRRSATPSDPAGSLTAELFLAQIRGTCSGDPSLPEMLDPMRPTLIDVLYLPADDFLLSANRGMDGYAVTITFAERNGVGWDTLKERLRALSEIVQRASAGACTWSRTSRPSGKVLREMYGDAFTKFLALKAKYDPRGMLENDFFDRVFGEAPPSLG